MKCAISALLVIALAGAAFAQMSAMPTIRSNPVRIGPGTQTMEVTLRPDETVQWQVYWDNGRPQSAGIVVRLLRGTQVSVNDTILVMGNAWSFYDCNQVGASGALHNTSNDEAEVQLACVADMGPSAKASSLDERGNPRGVAWPDPQPVLLKQCWVSVPAHWSVGIDLTSGQLDLNRPISVNAWSVGGDGTLIPLSTGNYPLPNWDFLHPHVTPVVRLSPSPDRTLVQLSSPLNFDYLVRYLGNG